MVGGNLGTARRIFGRAITGASLVTLLVGTASGPVAATGSAVDRPLRAFATERTADGHLRVVRYNRPAGPSALSVAPAKVGVVTDEVDSPVAALGAPDPRRGSQWALNATSFEATWPITRGSITVAVVDSGVRGNHEDLTGTVLPGIDYVDHTDGRQDPNGHGTHVAGIIAATANNGKGIAGGAPGVKILPVRVLDASGSGYSSNVAQGIIWATDHGARVINLSLGGITASSGTRGAIKYANSKGAVVLAAAGNDGDGMNQPLYPAAFPETIAVGAVASNLSHASFSNHGSLRRHRRARRPHRLHVRAVTDRLRGHERHVDGDAVRVGRGRAGRVDQPEAGRDGDPQRPRSRRDRPRRRRRRPLLRPRPHRPACRRAAGAAEASGVRHEGPRLLGGVERRHRPGVRQGEVRR